MPNGVWSGGPAVRSKDNRLVSGIRGPGLPLQSCSVGHEVRVELAGDVTFQTRMTSRIVLPSATRRATYLRVRSSPLMRVNTMRHRAWLAWRFPPGVQTVTVDFPRRRRQWCDAAQMREGASLFSRCGLSPAATSRIAAVLIPTP